jgi:hypothetical protein
VGVVVEPPLAVLVEEGALVDCWGIFVFDFFFASPVSASEGPAAGGSDSSTEVSVGGSEAGSIWTISTVCPVVLSTASVVETISRIGMVAANDSQWQIIYCGLLYESRGNERMKAKSTRSMRCPTTIMHME